MTSIAIQLPHISSEQEIEIEVKVNGETVLYNYRVEIFFWDECEVPKENKAECIRRILGAYNPEWELYQIGMPTDQFVPITFRKRRLKHTSQI